MADEKRYTMDEIRLAFTRVLQFTGARSCIALDELETALRGPYRLVDLSESTFDSMWRYGIADGRDCSVPIMSNSYSLATRICRLLNEAEERE